MKEISINDIEGYRIGNASNVEGATGCTVILCPEGAVTGISVQGGGPASRDTELLNPKALCNAVFGILLTGGSAFGLGAADGVMKYLEERNIGFNVGKGVVPIVPTSAIFDLLVGDFKCRPDGYMGYSACLDAEKNPPFRSGNVGAGTGAAVGKIKGVGNMMKGGLGSYAVQVGNLKVGAIVAVNALGDIFDIDTGKELAGMLNDEGTDFESTCRLAWETVEEKIDVFAGNTTIGCVITNAALNKSQCSKLAEMCHDGYARAIRPVHTTADGDTIYFMSKGDVEVGQDKLGDLSAYVMAKAIADAVNSAEPAYGIKAACQFK